MEIANVGSGIGVRCPYKRLMDVFIHRGHTYEEISSFLHVNYDLFPTTDMYGFCVSNPPKKQDIAIMDKEVTDVFLRKLKLLRRGGGSSKISLAIPVMLFSQEFTLEECHGYVSRYILATLEEFETLAKYMFDYGSFSDIERCEYIVHVLDQGCKSFEREIVETSVNLTRQDILVIYGFTPAEKTNVIKNILTEEYAQYISSGVNSGDDPAVLAKKRNSSSRKIMEIVSATKEVDTGSKEVSDLLASLIKAAGIVKTQHPHIGDEGYEPGTIILHAEDNKDGDDNEQFTQPQDGG